MKIIAEDYSEDINRSERQKEETKLDLFAVYNNFSITTMIMTTSDILVEPCTYVTDSQIMFCIM